MEAKPSKQKFWLHRSHSFSGVTYTKPDPSSVPTGSATVYAPIRVKRDSFLGSAAAAVASPAAAGGNAEPERIGRFKLKRYNAERKGVPVSFES